MENMKEKSSLLAKKLPMSAILGLNEVPGYNRHVFTLATGLYLHHSVHVTKRTYSISNMLSKVSLEIYCPYLSSPDNGRTELSAGLSFGSVVTFSCNHGHDVTINNEKANVETVQLKCEQEGRQERARGVWRGKLTSRAPTCQRK